MMATSVLILSLISQRRGLISTEQKRAKQHSYRAKNSSSFQLERVSILNLVSSPPKWIIQYLFRRRDNWQRKNCRQLLVLVVRFTPSFESYLCFGERESRWAGSEGRGWFCELSEGDWWIVERKPWATEPITSWISWRENNTLMTSSNEVPGLPGLLRPAIHLGTCQPEPTVQGLSSSGYGHTSLFWFISKYLCWLYLGLD